MFEKWDSFYLLTGGAGGAIIGLLFVVATLMRGDDPDNVLKAADTYLTPIVFHLSMVLGVSAFTAAPRISPAHQGVVLGACALLGLARSYQVIHSLGVSHKVQPSHWSDIWWYGHAALAAYLPLLAGAAAVWLAPNLAADLVAASVLAILFVAIRNAWDLVTWISIKMREPETPEKTKTEAAKTAGSQASP
jgi:hypothetical protein